MLSCCECGKEFPLKDRYAVDFEWVDTNEGVVKQAVDFCSASCHALFQAHEERR